MAIRTLEVSKLWFVFKKKMKFFFHFILTGGTLSKSPKTWWFKLVSYAIRELHKSWVSRILLYYLFNAVSINIFLVSNASRSNFTKKKHSFYLWNLILFYFAHSVQFIGISSIWPIKNSYKKTWKHWRKHDSSINLNIKKILSQKMSALKPFSLEFCLLFQNSALNGSAS